MEIQESLHSVTHAKTEDMFLDVSLARSALSCINLSTTLVVPVMRGGGEG